MQERVLQTAHPQAYNFCWGYDTSFTKTFSLELRASNDGESTLPLGNLFQWLITPAKKMRTITLVCICLATALVQVFK